MGAEQISFTKRHDAAKEAGIDRALRRGMIEVDECKLDRLQNMIREMAPMSDPGSALWDLFAMSKDLRS